MEPRTVAEIEEIRRELGELAQRRKDLPQHARRQFDSLLDRDELETRLLELQDEGSDAVAGEAEREAAAHTDITHPLAFPRTRPDDTAPTP